MALNFIPGYMRTAFDGSLTPLVRQTRSALKGVDYDTLVGTGLSGALVVPTLGRRLRKHWLIVRKPGDGSHDYRKVVGYLGQRYVFIDDFSDTGDTYYRVRETIKEEAAGYWDFSDPNGARLIKPECVGMYEYENNRFRPWRERKTKPEPKPARRKLRAKPFLAKALREVEPIFPNATVTFAADESGTWTFQTGLSEEMAAKLLPPISATDVAKFFDIPVEMISDDG